MLQPAGLIKYGVAHYEGAAPHKSQASIKAPARPVVAFEDAAAIVLDGKTDCDQDDRSAESPLQLEWRCMQPLLGHMAWELSGLDHSHAATPQRVTRASCAQLLRSVLGAACR